MRNFKKWVEGVNPTDVDSAGKDQNLSNAGEPFNMKVFAELEELKKKYVSLAWNETNKEQLTTLQTQIEELCEKLGVEVPAWFYRYSPTRPTLSPASFDKQVNKTIKLYN